MTTIFGVDGFPPPLIGKVGPAIYIIYKHGEGRLNLSVWGDKVFLDVDNRFDGVDFNQEYDAPKEAALDALEVLKEWGMI